MATVLVVAFTLAVAALVGGWLTSMTQTETSTIESGMQTQIECSKGAIDIVSLTASGAIIQNVGQVDFTEFSVVCGTNTSTDTLALNTGHFGTIDSGAGCNTTGNVVRITPIDCPNIFVECTVGTDCPS